MAIVSGFFTNIKGKVGNTIFQVIKGVQVMKTRVIPDNPNSPGQVAARGVFGDIVTGFKRLAETWIRYFWDPSTTTNKTGWGNFIGANLTSMGKLAFDITKAIGSIGTLEGVEDLAAEYDTATGDIAIDWKGDFFSNGSAEDYVSFFAYDKESNSVEGFLYSNSQRTDEGDTLTISKGLTATDIEVFLVVSQNEPVEQLEGLISDCQHCTCTAPV